MKRCRWCQCFVKRDTEPTIRSVKGVRDGVLAWRTYSQILCPACARSWSMEHPWNRAPLPDETPQVLS